jgi:hypothetical protein
MQTNYKLRLFSPVSASLLSFVRYYSSLSCQLNAVWKSALRLVFAFRQPYRYLSLLRTFNPLGISGWQL